MINNILKKKIKFASIIKFLKLNIKIKKNFLVKNFTSLKEAKKGDLTFFSNHKYINDLKKTEASACVISIKYKNFLPNSCFPIISEEVFSDFIKIINFFYNEFNIDKISQNLSKKHIKKKYKNISFGENFICEKFVKLGKNIKIGNNVIIKNNSIIHDNVNIGSNVLIANSIIEKNVNICDGSIIGKKGFGFKFINGKLLRIPHLGKVIIKSNAEIGSNCNIDRGSITDTVIGEYTFIDNQVQIAHNVKIGNYCMIAAQVGISGSTIIGNHVLIGGQSGISGHLKIGNNVKIGGKSGVIKNIDDNQSVMGYPAISLRDFVKKNKK